MQTDVPSRAPLTIADAQREMRHAYFDGAPGVAASATAWLAAGLVAATATPERAIWTLFAGGVLIHPVSMLVVKLLGRPGRHSPGNPLGALALATTAWLILSLPLAYAASWLDVRWFFPAMLLVIGGRYLTFAPMFGSRAWWLLGGALAAAGWLLARAGAAPAQSALTGAAIEAAFAIALFALVRRGSRVGPA